MILKGGMMSDRSTNKALQTIYLSAACMLFAMLFGARVSAQGAGSVPEKILHYADTVVLNGKIVTTDNKAILSSNPGSIVEAMAI